MALIDTRGRYDSAAKEFAETHQSQVGIGCFFQRDTVRADGDEGAFSGKNNIKIS